MQAASSVRKPQTMSDLNEQRFEICCLYVDSHDWGLMWWCCQKHWAVELCLHII